MLTTTPATATSRTVHRVLTRRRRTAAARAASEADVAHPSPRVAPAPWSKWLALG